MLVNIGEHVPTGCHENCIACLLDRGNQNKVEIARLISEIASILHNPCNAKSIRETARLTVSGIVRGKYLSETTGLDRLTGRTILNLFHGNGDTMEPSF